MEKDVHTISYFHLGINLLPIPIAQFIRSAKVNISNAFAYFSILKLAYARLK